MTITRQKTINLSGFCDTSDGTDNGKLPINVLIVPEIAVPMKTYVRNITNLKYLFGLKLDHPVSHDPMVEDSLLNYI